MILNRRAWLGAASVLGAAGLFEALNLTGTFDHRNAVPVADNSLWRGTFTRLERLGEYVNGIGVIGHCTYVMVIKGVRVMTDPWFFDPAFGVLEHSKGPAALPEDIGPLHGIVLSHAHPDHFDRSALSRLDKSAKVFVPTDSMARAVRRMGYTQVSTLKPWQSAQLGKATITAVPATHDVTEIGYVLHSDANARTGSDGIYFAGDTALSPAMNDIRERLQPKLAILPVDGGQRWLSAPPVMDLNDAIEATRRLGVRRVVPTHDGIACSGFLAKRLYRRTPDAAAAFAARVSKELKGVLCIVPKTGDFVRM